MLVHSLKYGEVRTALTNVLRSEKGVIEPPKLSILQFCDESLHTFCVGISTISVRGYKPEEFTKVGIFEIPDPATTENTECFYLGLTSVAKTVIRKITGFASTVQVYRSVEKQTNASTKYDFESQMQIQKYTRI